MTLARIPAYLSLPAVAVAYFLAAVLGLNWATMSGVASPVWPAAGVGLAGAALFGYRAAAAVALASLVAVAGADQPFSAKLAIALGNAAESAIGAYLLRRLKVSAKLDHVNAVLAFVLVVAASSSISALIGPTAVSLAGARDWPEWAELSRTCWLGHLLGTLVVAPLILTWLEPAPSSSAPSWSFLLIVVLLTAAVGLLTSVGVTSFFVLFSFFPLLLWASMSHGQRGTTLSLFFLAALSVARVSPGRGLLGTESVTESVLVVQQFLGVLCVTFLFFAAVVEERTRSADASRRSQQTMNLAYQAARIGVFEWNRESGVNSWTPDLEKLYGLAEGSFPRTRDAWLELIHPEDRERAASVLESAFRTSEPAEGEWRVIRPDGSVRWLFGRFQVFAGERGESARLSGVNIDITERKRAEERFRLAIEAAPSAVLMADEGGTVVLVNSLAESMFGYPREELLGRPVEVLVPERFRAAHPSQFGAFLRAPTARAMGAGRDLYGLHRDGREIPIEIGLNPFRTEQGTFVLASIIDITERKRAEERFRLAIEAAPTAMLMVDQAGTVVLVNSLVESTFGYSREELLGRPVEVLVPERLRAMHSGDRQDFLRSPTARAMGAGRDLYGLHRDGREIPIEIGLNPFRTEQGTFVLASIIDITERKRAERTLRESESNFRSFFDTVAVGAVQLDASGRFLRVNDRYCEIVGYSRNELLGGLGPKDLDHPEDREAESDRLAQFLAGKLSILETEKRYLRKDGRAVWVRVSASPILDESGKLRLTAGVIEDVTERRRAGNALHEREEQLRIFIEHSPVALAMFDREMRYLHASRRWKSDLRLDAGDLRGRSHYEVFPDISDRWKAIHRRSMSGEVIRAAEDRYDRADGTTQWMRWEVRPWFDSAGGVGGILIYSEDITQRKLAEAEVEASRRMLALVLENIPQGVFWKDWHSRYVGCNKVVARAFGLAAPEQIVGRDDYALPGLTDEQVQHFRLKDRQVMDSTTPEYGIIEPATLADGTSIWMETSKVPMYDESGKVIGVLGTWQDITNRKQAEEALRENEERLTLATEAADIGFFDWNVQKDTVYYSPRLKAQLGHEPHEIADTWEDFASRLHPADRPAVMATIRSFIGKPRPDYTAEFRMRHKDGTYRTIQSRATLVADGEGRPLRMLGTHLDITDRKQAEEGLRDSLVEKETLLKEVHHRVKNNLAVIDSLLTMQANRTPDSHASAVLRDACNRVHSMALIHETLYRARDLAHVELPAYVRSLIDHLFDSFGVPRDRIRLHLEIAPISIDLELAVPIGLLINELSSNVLKHAFAQTGSGEVRISLSVDEENQARLLVADDGSGLPADLNVREARSLGLRLVHSLARQIGGFVEFDPPRGDRRGTMVVVTFPFFAPEGVENAGSGEADDSHRRG